MPEGYTISEYQKMKDAKKLMAERILEATLELKAEVAEVKRMLGDSNMQPINARLTRLETKVTQLLMDNGVPEETGL